MEMNGKCEIICPVPACNCHSNERCEIEKNKYGCDMAICNCLPGYRKNGNQRHGVSFFRKIDPKISIILKNRPKISVKLKIDPKYRSN